MNMKHSLPVLAVVSPILYFLLLSADLAAQDWPQWRGPSSLGVSTESRLPVSWGPETNIAWKVSLAGFGASSPIVSGDRVFVTSQVGKVGVRAGSHPQLARDDPSLAGRERVMEGLRMESTADKGDVFLIVEAFQRSDGRRLWEFRTKAIGDFPQLHEKHNLASPTPTTDGERVYAWFGSGQIVALDMDGRVVWGIGSGTDHAKCMHCQDIFLRQRDCRGHSRIFRGFFLQLIRN